MHQLEYEILTALKNSAGKELSTSQFVSLIFPETNKTEHSDYLKKSKHREVAKKKAGLHRKLLYHINRLAGENLITESGVGKRGEKKFRLNLSPGEEIIIEQKQRRFVITRPSLPALPIEGFEQKKMIFRFAKDTWTTRLNCILLNLSSLKTLREVKSVLNESFSIVNDAIGMRGFESLLQSLRPEEIEDLADFMTLSSEDFSINLTLLIDIKQVYDNSFLSALDSFLRRHKGGPKIVFSSTIKNIERRSNFFGKIVEIYEGQGKILYIQNTSIKESPYMLGRAGPYCLSEVDWVRLKESDYICIPVADSSIALDVKRFLGDNISIVQFRNMIRKILKSLFIASSSQRTLARTLSSSVNRMNKRYNKDIFRSKRSYIRFWNYGWKQKNMDQGMVLDLIKSTKKDVDDFCLTETAIFKACGIPTDFTMAFSCAFSGYSDGMSQGLFAPLQIRTAEELYVKAVRKHLRAKEYISKVFDGGDRMRFVRTGNPGSGEVLREIEMIMNVYKLPFFCYDFGQIRIGDQKLTSFIKNG